MTTVTRPLLAAIVLLTLFALPVMAQEDDSKSQAKSLSGTYTLSLSKTKARAKINKAIESVVADMNFIKRPFARDALEENTTPCTKLRITFPKNKISVRCDSKPASVSDNDKVFKYKAQDGTIYKMRQKHSGRVLRQTFYGEDGQRTNTMILSKKGNKLEMSVQITSDQLPRPLDYELVFVKK